MALLFVQVHPKTRGVGVKRIAIADFRDYRRDRFIDAHTGPAARLAPMELLTNEMGADAGYCDELTADCWSRIVFEVPSAKVKGAELLFYVNADEKTQ